MLARIGTVQSCLRVLLGVIVVVALYASPPRYFPAGSFGSKASIEQLKTEWYSSKLAALHESSLWEVSRQHRSIETYRFLWLRTFHHPLSIRVTVAGGGAGVLEAKETDGFGGLPGLGKLIRDDKRILSKGELELFFTKLDLLRLWVSQNDNEYRGGPDGAQWVLEAVKNGKYRILDVWSPEDSDSMRSFGIAILALAHVEVPPAEFY
jgi:hypothetical protein